MSNSESKINNPKSILVKVLQWFYLLLFLVSSTAFLWSKQIPLIAKSTLPEEIVIVASIISCIYFLIIALSFLTQNTNMLILSLVLIFFTSIGAAILLIITIPNAQTILSGNIPKCAAALSTCSVTEGVVVASALFMAISVPILLLNIITIIGTIKDIASTD
jgi:hypothetical protein